MKALVKKYPEKGLWMEEVPEPIAGPNDVKIKIHKTAICGTDLHIYNWDEWSQKTIKTPQVIGHEYVGEIVEVGANVQNWKVGQMVSGEGHIVCGKCRNCLAGNGHLCKETVDIFQIITHRMDVADFEKGFAAMNSGKSGKIILDWSSLHSR